MCKYKNERYENGENMKNVMIGTYVKGEELIDFNFGTDLSIFEKQKFVNAVVGLVVDEKNYNSVLRNLIFDFYIVDMLTDIDTTELRQSPNFVNDVEKFLDETNIIDIVKANATPALFEELNSAIDKSIEYITGIHTNPLGEALASLVNALEKKISGIDLDGMMATVQKFAGMTDKLTPESVVNAYINSDTHKKNLAEIAESRVDKAEFAEALDKAIKAVNEENKSGE